jgi:hypothetical protein
VKDELREAGKIAFFNRFGPDCDEAYSQRWHDRDEAWNAALQAAQRGEIPGWQLVPVEPTQAMLDADASSTILEAAEFLNKSTRYTWNAMLAAAKEEAGQ